MLYESFYALPGVAHSNYLLRQQSENEYLRSKNRSILRFSAVFLDFLIFRICDDFGVVLPSIPSPWLDFLPGAASRSLLHWISSDFKFFCSYRVHVPTLNCRNLDACTSAGALALHAKIFK